MHEMQNQTVPYAFVMEITLRELRSFVAVCEAGTFTDAAIELGLSQAAVSRAVAGLEARLGHDLLIRTPRGAVPTGLGEDLLPHARRVLAEVAAFGELAASRHRVLRLGYAWSAVGRHTTPLLRSWATDHPDTELRLVRANSATAGLAEGRCDAAVVRVEVGPEFESVVVGLERRLVAFATDDPAWGRRRTLTMAEVAERPLLVDTRTGTTRPELWPAGHEPRRLVETADVETWLDTIAAGQGVGMTAEATAHHHPRPGVTYRRVGDGPPIPVRVTWRRDDPPAAIGALTGLLTQLYAGD